MRSKIGKAHLAGVLIAAIIFIAGIAAEIGQNPKPAKAISGLSFSVDNAAVSANSTATVNLTAANAVTAQSRRIYLDFQGINGSGCPTSSVAVAAGTSPSTLAIYSTNCTSVALTSSSTIAAGTAITVKLSNFKNFTNAGTYFGHGWLSDGGSTDVEGSSGWGGATISNGVQFGSPNLSGTITAGGQAVPWANYQIRNSNYSVNVYGYTGADGKYSASLANGSYTFSLMSPSSADASGSATIYGAPADATVTVSGATVYNTSYAAPNKTISGKITYDASAGSPVTNVRVSASRNNGGGWGSVKVAADGSYSFLTYGGDWYLSINSINWPSDWLYNSCGSGSSGGDTVILANDTTVQSVTKNFVVSSLNSTATFSVKKPDGNPPTASTVWVNFSLSTSTCSSFSATIDASGNGTAKLAAGTYSVNGSVSDTTLSFPTIANFTIGVVANLNLGTWTLVERDSRITGKVSASTGEAIAGVYVNGWVESSTSTPVSSGWSNATTDYLGNYTLFVTGDKDWNINASPPSGSGGSSNYAYSWEPVKIKVAKNSTVTKNFTLKKNSNTFYGTIAGEDGATLTSINGSVNASEGSSGYSAGGGYATIVNGAFTLKLPAGTSTLTAYFWESGGGASTYDSGDPVKVTFTGDNQTASGTLTAIKASAKIQGKIYDTNKKLITGQWVSVHATKNGKIGSWKSANFNQSTAEYTFNASPGTWTVGFYMPATTGYMSSVGQEKEITVKDGETAVYDIIVKEAKFTAKGKTTKANGNALPYAGITIDSRDSSSKTSTYENYFGSYASSNGNGDYVVPLPEGTYFIGGSSYWGQSNQLNPKKVKITLNDANPSAEVNLTFREANAEITGTAKIGTSAAAYAYLTAHDESADSETTTNGLGNFSIKASQGTTWAVSATYVDGKKVYRSKPTRVEVSSDKVALGDIELVEQKFTLPAAASAAFNATEQYTMTLEDKTTLTFPANSLATSGTVTVTATPTANLPEEDSMDPLAYGVDYKAKDNQSGQDIATFPKDITIASAYSDSWTTDNKVTAQELVPAYLDDSIGNWKALTSYVVDDNANTVTFATNHFTKFALVAATDTTPPAAPTDINVTAKNESATLTWTNPTDADFASVTVYRSTESGKLGDKIKTGATGASHDDTGLTNSTTYYYTVRSVDKTGNESINTTQVSATPSVEAGIKAANGGVLPTTGRPHTPAPWWYLATFLSLTLAGWVARRAIARP